MTHMNLLFLRRQAFSLIAILLLPMLSHTQTTLQTIGHYQYARYNDGWYTTQQGRQGDLVDTNHVIVRPKNNTMIGAFVFAKAGLPTMKDTRGSFSGGYYELEVPKGLDPFFVARALEATSYFDEVLFNVFYAVESVPNDPRYPNQWAIPKTKTHDAWDITTGSSSSLPTNKYTPGLFDDSRLPNVSSEERGNIVPTTVVFDSSIVLKPSGISSAR